MPLTKAENSPGLSLEFEKPRPHYSPGDVIRGRVVLNTAADIAIGTIAVSFWARAKSRIVQQHGQSVTYHRGRTHFFNYEHVLYEGQYTHKPGSFSWPFEFVVPSQADPGCILAGERWKPKDHYRTTLVDPSELDLNLPASCYHSRMTFGRRSECFVEYVLKARMTEPDGVHKIRKAQTKTSVCPIVFHPLSTPEPIQNYDFTTDRRLITFSTLKLLPEHAGTSLGFRDRARSIFQRDSIPRFSFTLGVQAPSVIQLFHPRPIPFLITATPDLSPENTTIEVDSTSQSPLPTVTLRSATVELKTHVRCRAAGTFADTKSYEIPILSSSQVLNQPLKFVRGTATASGSEATLDLGQLCNLGLGNAKLGSRLEAPLCPNFTSYNVSREYQLTWELELECAEKTERFSSVRNGPQCTVLLPPATGAGAGAGIMDTGPDMAMLGGDLAPAMSATSTGSGSASGSGSGFWSLSRRSHEGRGGEKEKAGFNPPTATSVTAGIEALGVTDKTKKKKKKSKDDEAAEDRARARLLQSEVQYQSGYVNPFTSSLSSSPPPPPPGDRDETQRPQGHGAHGLPVQTDVDVDPDNQLPKYVP